MWRIWWRHLVPPREQLSFAGGGGLLWPHGEVQFRLPQPKGASPNDISCLVCVCVCVRVGVGVSSVAAESAWSSSQGFSLSLVPVTICTLFQATVSTRPCAGGVVRGLKGLGFHAEAGLACAGKTDCFRHGCCLVSWYGCQESSWSGRGGCSQGKS